MVWVVVPEQVTDAFGARPPAGGAQVTVPPSDGSVTVNVVRVTLPVFFTTNE